MQSYCHCVVAVLQIQSVFFHLCHVESCYHAIGVCELSSLGKCHCHVFGCRAQSCLGLEVVRRLVLAHRHVCACCSLQISVVGVCLEHWIVTGLHHPSRVSKSLKGIAGCKFACKHCFCSFWVGRYQSVQTAQLSVEICVLKVVACLSNDCSCLCTCSCAHTAQVDRSLNSALVASCTHDATGLASVGIHSAHVLCVGDCAVVLTGNTTGIVSRAFVHGRVDVFSLNLAFVQAVFYCCIVKCCDTSGIVVVCHHIALVHTVGNLHLGSGRWHIAHDTAGVGVISHHLCLVHTVVDGGLCKSVTHDATHILITVNHASGCYVHVLDCCAARCAEQARVVCSAL